MKRNDNQQTYTEPARTIPVLDQAAIVVVGGSPTGVAAAVAAAREGRDVLLIEQYGCLGGQMAVGLIMTPGQSTFYDGDGRLIVGGFARELVDRLIKEGGADPAWAWNDPAERVFVESWLDPEAVKVVLAEFASSAQVHLLTHAVLADAIVQDGRVTGVIVETKAGRFAVRGRAFIDATGDGDLAARAGAKFETGRRFKPALFNLVGNVRIEVLLESLAGRETQLGISPPARNLADLKDRFQRGRSFRFGPIKALVSGTEAVKDPIFNEIAGGELHWIREGLVHIDSISMPVDALDPVAMTRAEIHVRRKTWDLVNFFRKFVPGFEGAYLLPTSPTLAVRETRSIQGLHRLSNQEVLEGAAFKDTIALSRGHDVASKLTKGYHAIPYRALVPAGVQGLLVAGRCISTESEVARNALRGIVPCICTGQAAGVAAALAVKIGSDNPAKVPVKFLQERLRRQGVILPGDSK